MRSHKRAMDVRTCGRRTRSRRWPTISTVLPPTLGSEGTSQKLERFQIFAAIALAFAGVEMLLVAIPRGSRSRASRLAKLWPAAAASIFIAALCSTTVADINEATTSTTSGSTRRRSISIGPRKRRTPPELSHNAANALDQLRQYDAAVEEALKARGRSGDDAAQEAQIEYGIGNHYVGAGNLFSAIEAYKRSLLADSTDEDAKHNLEE